MIKDQYPDGICPDCGEPIPDDMEEGGECENCPHVFYENAVSDDVPGEDDITTNDHRNFRYNGKPIVETSMEEYNNDTEAGLKAVAHWMKTSLFYPNVWFISDHGNPILQDMGKYL